MTTKQYLNQIERLDRMIQNKLAEIYKLKTMSCSVSVSKDNDRVQTSADKDRLGSTVANIVDLEEETNALMTNFKERRNHIISQIDSMENTDYYHVLSLRYVGGNTFQSISNMTNWSMRQVFNIHGRALQEFEKLYGTEYLESMQ